MAQPTYRRIVLAARPEGEPTPDHFRLETAPVPEPGPGQVLIRVLWLSLDPYMRGRMSAAKSYAKPVEIGEVMEGGTVGEVVASNHPDYAPGDFVLSHSGWQEYAIADGDSVRKLDPNLAPLSTALGVLGMPGMTAYTGLLNIGQPKPGETVVVAAAAGPVGSAVGQIAKIKGCHVVGIAGGAEKCAYLLNELAFDAAIDHRAPDMPERLADACPKGIDVYFENVGGEVWNAVFPLLNDFARIPVCGLVAHYNDTTLPPGPDRTPLLMRTILSKRLTLRGFIVRDFASQADEFRREVGSWLRAGQIKYREDVVEGLENAPEAFVGMLKGRNFGKMLVQVGRD
ncbi:NADP-dependent oxidoreductase (plasmid) [Microvirga ossetica]|uniref:NADP-dependent oxidoreductase n=1 Tax=Microvirga ossetica TaxID=1882682 RepID=A0A1B2EV46_9HYPH|nr:NADP-dependent oxidoreductase [Microvirga ossetica]ANY83833.1 NADP-dependent oxidoreductase [Microvirga ossetica]